MSLSNYVEQSVMYYNNATVKITKVRKAGLVIMGSVDGNHYGLPYDKTIAAGFSDKKLKGLGYTEIFGHNGSTFYTWSGDCFAEGLEIAFGANHQDFSLSCVAKFNETMAVGFTYDGRLVFDKQKNLMATAGDYYGAVTFAFGIMKDWSRAEWGRELSASDRNSIYENISGRTILGQNDEYIFQLSIAGVTGKSGLRGSQLYSLCEKLGMKDAGCFDGGGSVWARVLGKYVNSTSRLVKNAVMIWAKEEEQVTPTPEPTPDPKPKPTDGIYITCTRVTTSKGYPTRRVLDDAAGFTDKYIQVGETLKVKDINSMPGKLDGFCQIDGGDKDNLWFAFDPDYFE